MTDRQFETPMMQQYIKIKSKYKDCLLFFRLGDFYELFLEDAEIGSKILDITLTARNKGKDGKVAMCGVPYHAIDSYLSRIVKAGYKAAICEQVSDASAGSEIVEREVIRIVTPGTILNEGMLDKKTNNYLLTFIKSKNGASFAYTDISTGKFFVFSKTKTNPNQEIDDIIVSEAKKISPQEIILEKELYENKNLIRKLQENVKSNIFINPSEKIDEKDKYDYLTNFFQVKSLDIFQINSSEKALVEVATNLLAYLRYTQKDNLFHIKQIQNETNSSYMKLDAETINNLEIFENNSRNLYYQKKNKSDVISVIDQTQTSMGARLLKQWAMFPLINKKLIDERLDLTSDLIKDHNKRENISSYLSKILDIERLLSKLGTGTSNARDVIALGSSLRSAIDAIKMGHNPKSLILDELEQKISKVINIISTTFKDDPPVSIREGNMIKDGIDQKLDDIKNSISDSKEWIAQLESKEKERTKINNLKVGFNSVFGYYIEISKSNVKSVPQNYVRKQTLVNAERYITEELKYKEGIVLTAQDQINKIEYEIFQSKVKEILIEAEAIQKLSNMIANLDCLVSFAQTALEKNYSRPEILESNKYALRLVEARHPVVESVLSAGEFNPNSTDFNKTSFIHLITGPNMSGKSTYIRQVALIQILAQMGSYVPAYKAEISIVDGIYTRIGAGDALAQGLSTFMVEMIETAKILHNATENSLIILDEVGRGTSTIDGLSIARAVVEYIHDKIKAKTLFATHFHELVQMSQRFKKIENFHVKVSEDKGEIKFLHKVEKGGTDKSYGIEVAKLAGVPDEVVKKAKQHLEQNTQAQLKLDI